MSTGLKNVFSEKKKGSNYTISCGENKFCLCEKADIFLCMSKVLDLSAFQIKQLL